MASLENIPVVGDVLKKVENTGEKIMDDIKEGVSATITDNIPGLGDAAVTSGSNVAFQAVDNVVAGIPIEATTGTTDDFYSCGVEVGVQETNISKLQFLGSGQVNSGGNNNGPVLLKVFLLPGIFFDNNSQPSFGQGQYFRFLRSGFRFVISVNVPAGCSGNLIMSFVPPGIDIHDYNNQQTTTFFDNRVDLRTIFSVPYTLLDLAKATEAHLTVPYVSYKNYMRIDGGADMDDTVVRSAFLYIWRLTPMGLPSNGSNVIDYSVYGELLEPDFQCPRPYGQGRKRRALPKPPPKVNQMKRIVQHSTPGAVNLASSVTIENADSLAIAGDRTCVDLVTAGCNAVSHSILDVLRRWQIFDYLSWSSSQTPGAAIYNWHQINFQQAIFALVCDKFTYWRGSIEIKVIFFPSRFHSGRYQIGWYPPGFNQAPNNQNMRETMRNSISVVGDVGVAPVTLTLPFTHQSWRRKTQENYGFLAISVLNRLTYNATTTNSIYGVILMRAGKDFELYAPTYGFKYLQAQGLENQLGDDEDNPEVLFVNFQTPHINIQTTSHMLNSSLFGRSAQVAEITASPTTGTTRVKQTAIFVPVAGHLACMAAYAYYSGELIFTVQNTHTSQAIVGHSFENYPNLAYVNQAMWSIGAVVVPPNGVKQFAVPFYSETPFRVLATANSGRTPNAPPPFGYLYTENGGTLLVYMSLRNPNFVFPICPPIFVNRATSRMIDIYPDDGPVAPLGQSIVGQDPDTNEAKLMQSGDVESNPGPVISLVKKNRGVYSHYGVKTDEKIFAMDTENPLKSFLKGHVNITCVEDDGSWEVVDTREVDFDLALSILTANKEHYSIDWNCENWAKELCQIEDETQGDRIKRALYVMMVLNGAFVVTQSSDLLSKFVKLLSDRVFASLENEIIKLVLRTIVRIVCYLILYAHAPNLLTTGALAVLLALDVTGNSIDKKLMGMIQGLIDGDFNKFCGDLLEHVDCDKKDLKKTIPKFAPPVTQQPKGMGCCPISCCTFVGQSPKDFNEWSNVGKNIKWWIEQVLMVINWLKDKLFSNNVVKAADWLEENVTMVALTIARTDQFLMDYHQDKSTCFKPEAKEVCGKLLDALSGISFALSQANDRSTLLPRVNSLIAKLESLRFDAMQAWKFRMEPYGIWVSGAPGVGKSFFSHYIAQSIAKKYGWTIYSNPSGSEHMDGYLNQEIHLFDDLGQIRDENDLKLICNLISSIPFIVPKADLESKGTYYNGKLVIATTNKGDFSSVVLADPEALKRRFPATYQIRPRPHYELNGKLNVAMANQTGDLATGNMWQTWIGGQWVDLDMGRLIDGLCKNIDSRLKIANIVGQDGEGKKTRREFKTLDDLNGLLDEMQENFDDLVLRIDSIQEQTRMFNDTKETKSIAQKIKTKFVEWINKTKDFCERNKAWFLIAGALGTISSLCFLAWEVYERYKENKPSEGESAYNGVFRPAKKVFVNKLTKVKGQSPQFEHILNRMAIVQTKSGPATALAFAGKSLITYGHGHVEKLTHFRDTEMDIKLKSVHMLADGEPQDLQILTPENQKELPYQFKDLSPLIHNEDYCGDGVLIWKTTSGYHFKDVKQIHPIGQLTTEDNITTTYNYAYFVQNHFGMCGGVLVGMVNGNPKILGIHMAGNGTLAVAARLYPTFTQGYVANKEKMPKPLYHLNTKSKFRGSPLQHVLDGDEEPAVLSKFDPRLKNPVDDVVKSAAAKYRGNRFTVPEDIFREAKRLVQQRIFSVVGNCRPLTYEEACNTEIMPIDWSTSPGHKYAGRTKHELIDDEDFKQDVAQCLENPKTIFVTHLKDELRSKEKVEIGKTRAIEAASFDYVMATRMRCGDFFRKIYQDRYCRSGLAVGINPYTDFCCLWDQLEEWNICLDYSAFDGSLSPELMEAAAEIIAYCYDEPEKVKAMIRPTIYSTNWVSDEIWTVEGGMCSGSPFTTILNSICGLLVAQTIYLHYGFEGVTFVYGDDAIWSVDKKVPIDDLAQLVYDNFGMYVTSAEKTDNIQYIMKEEVTFLKRRFVQWRSMITGALFPQNIRSHLRWCKSPDTFSDQLYMACIEMALNGKSEYMKFYEEVKPHYPIMTWEQVVSVVDSLVMT